MDDIQSDKAAAFDALFEAVRSGKTSIDSGEPYSVREKLGSRFGIPVYLKRDSNGHAAYWLDPQDRYVHLPGGTSTIQVRRGPFETLAGAHEGAHIAYLTIQAGRVDRLARRLDDVEGGLRLVANLPARVANIEALLKTVIPAPPEE